MNCVRLAKLSRGQIGDNLRTKAYSIEKCSSRFRVTSRDAELCRDLVTACCSVREEHQCRSLM